MHSSIHCAVCWLLICLISTSGAINLTGKVVSQCAPQDIVIDFVNGQRLVGGKKLSSSNAATVDDCMKALEGNLKAWSFNYNAKTKGCELFSNPVHSAKVKGKGFVLKKDSSTDNYIVGFFVCQNGDSHDFYYNPSVGASTLPSIPSPNPSSIGGSTTVPAIPSDPSSIGGSTTVQSPPSPGYGCRVSSLDVASVDNYKYAAAILKNRPLLTHQLKFNSTFHFADLLAALSLLQLHTRHQKNVELL